MPMLMKTGKNTPPHTHTAYAFKREGKKQRTGRFLEIGTARIDDSGLHVFLDRLPIGGFTGYVRLWPTGTTPPAPEPEEETAEPGDGDRSED